MTAPLTDPPDAQPIGPPPPFDPELAPVVEMLAGLRPPDAYRADDIEQMRLPVPGVQAPTDEALTRGDTYRVEQRTVPGPEGGPDIPLLICLPQHTATPTPAVYHVHGGGMILGDNRFGLVEMMDLAAPLGMAVVSVEYRLAPETPHPGPVEDCYAGLAWLSAHADELGIDPGRIVIGGASAGGGLVAGVTLMARDRHGPAVLGQLLMSPMLDDRNDSPSARQMRGLGIWDRSSNETGWNALLGDGVRGGPEVSGYAAPARAVELAGLPPTYVDVGSAETFRDEDVTYASRMWQAGGRVEWHVWPGGFHGFDVVAPHASISQDAIDARAAWLRRQMGKQQVVKTSTRCSTVQLLRIQPRVERVGQDVCMSGSAAHERWGGGQSANGPSRSPSRGATARAHAARPHRRVSARGCRVRGRVASACDATPSAAPSSGQTGQGYRQAVTWARNAQKAPSPVGRGPSVTWRQSW